MPISYVVNLFKPASHPPAIQSKAIVDRAYKYWRTRVFYSVYLGYVFYYFTRKSFTCAMPEMVRDLGYSASDLGIISTALYLSYAISKFASGILSDQANPRYVMSIGLILTGVFNILFGFSSSLIMLTIFWTCNGIFQGWGWPPITKQLTYWFSRKERAFWWGVCTTSHNIGGGIIPYLASFVMKYKVEMLALVGLSSLAIFSSWRYVMIVPGLLCILVGFFIMNRLRDVPQSLGLPPIEEYHNETEAYEDLAEEDKNAKQDNAWTTRQILVDCVLKNKFVWLMAATYFFVNVVRMAFNDWTLFYLESVLGYDKSSAINSIACFEAGGLIGMLIAGWISDVLFQGRRMPFVVLCAIGMSVSLYYFSKLPINNTSYELMCYVWSTLIGLFVFGPQMLVGLAAAEYVDKKAACTANGFVGCWASLGAAATGYPLGLLINVSWESYYWLLIGCSIMVLLLLAPFCFPKKQTPQVSCSSA